MGDGRPAAGFRNGFWAGWNRNELLSRVAGYSGTEIWCESPAERQYRVLDSWWSHREFEIFRAQFANEEERFQALLVSEGIASRFEVVGTYYDERGDGDDLVTT